MEISETQKLAQEVAGKLKPNDVLALYGDLGAGKTTFVNFLAKALGSDSRVQSPTFVIHRRYLGNGPIKAINHIDLYRLTDRKDVEDIGIQEVMNEPEAITIIEWPELVEGILPEKTIRIYFEYVDENERKIDVQNLS
jgi:tRNA threonylcarbamoyladenosine biosynthesis protein TsaE